MSKTMDKQIEEYDKLHLEWRIEAFKHGRGNKEKLKNLEEQMEKLYKQFMKK